MKIFSWQFFFRFILGCSVILITFCSPKSSPVQIPVESIKTYHFNGYIPDKTLTVNYTVSDSAAFLSAQTWIIKNLSGWENQNPIAVNDSVNGILTGLCTEYIAYIPFRVVVKDGIATLAFSGVNYCVVKTLEQEEQNSTRMIVENWLEDWSISFVETFD